MWVDKGEIREKQYPQYPVQCLSPPTGHMFAVLLLDLVNPLSGARGPYSSKLPPSRE